MEIKFVGPALFVQDIQASRRFYEEVMGQKLEFDFGVNISFAGGLSLWQREHATEVVFGRPVAALSPHHHDAEYYFETDELDVVCRRLEDARVEYAHSLVEQPWGARAVRFYDLDGHLIELSEPMPTVIQRLLAEGKSVEAVAEQTGMPLENVRQAAGA